jgi:DNA-binding protein HU-beta
MKGVNMNKADFVNNVAEDTGLSKTDAENALNAVLGNIEKVLKNDDSITFVGFGAFKVSDRKARVGRNPQTGEAINIAASKAPVFKAGKAFKDKLNGKDK